LHINKRKAKIKHWPGSSAVKQQEDHKKKEELTNTIQINNLKNPRRFVVVTCISPLIIWCVKVFKYASKRNANEKYELFTPGHI